MNRDAHFLQVALENGLITREQASWLHDARQQSLQGPIEQFLLQNQYLTQAQIQHIHALAASGKASQSASGSHSGSQIRVPSGSKAGSGISNSKDSHQSRMKKALAKGSGGLEAESSLAGYTIIQEIARGGMGAVYRAQRPGEDIVALKVMLAGDNVEERQLTRFQREIEAHQELDHPHIIKLLDSGQEGKRLYYTMELVEGGSLASVIDNPEYDIEDKVELLSLVARAVGFAHGHGLFHRDLKPDNILLTTDGEPKITDFGLAKSLVTQSDLTKTGSTVGTPSYMAPEQVRGETKTTDQRCDVWALGVILYQLISGDLPFKGSNIPQLYEAIQTKKAIDLGIRFRQAKTGLGQVISRCLEKEAKNRYPTGTELADDLDTWLEEGLVSVDGQSHASRLARGIKQGKASILLPLIGVLIFIGGGIGFYFWKLKAQEEDAARQIAQRFNDAQKVLERSLKSAQKKLEQGESGLEIDDAESARNAFIDALKTLDKVPVILDKVSPEEQALLQESQTYKSLQESRGKALINLAKTLDQTQINRTELQSLLTRLEEFKEPKFEKQRLFQISRLEYRLGRYERSRRALMGWRKYGALTPEAELFLGELYVAEGSLAPALQSFERVLRKAPDHKLAFLHRQSIQIQLKRDLDASLARLKKASKKSPEAMERLISSYFLQSDHRVSEGLDLAKNQWKKDKKRTGIAKDIARSYLFHSRPIDALEILKELRVRAPKDSQIRQFQILAQFLRSGVLNNSTALKELLELKSAQQETVLETLWLFHIAEQRQKKQSAEYSYNVLDYAGKDVKDAFSRRVLAEYHLAEVFLKERAAKGNFKAEESGSLSAADQREDRYQRAAAAHYLARWGQRSTAAPLVTQILKDSPQDSLTAFSQAHLSEDPDDLNRAYESYLNDHSRVGTVLYNNARTLFLRSVEMKHKKDFDRACALLDFARRRDPWALPNYEMQARFAFQSGRLPKMEALLNHWFRLAPYDPLAQLYMGLFLLDKKDVRGAAGVISKAYKTLGKTPLSFRAHIQLLLAENKYDSALQKLNQALRKNRYQLHLLQARVTACKKLGKLDTIKEDQEYIDCMVDPEKGAALVDKLEELVVDDFEKAEKIANHAMALQPYHPDCLLKQAGIFKSKKEKGYIFKAYLNLGDIFLHNFKLLDDPKYDFKNHIRYVLPPDKFYKQMEIYQNSNRVLTPRETWTILLLRYIEVMNGFKDPASIRDLLPLLDRVLHAYPEKLPVRFMQGWVRVLVGDNGGRAILEECLRYRPNYGPALFALAFAEAKNSQTKAAFQYLEKSSHRAEVAEKARHFKVFDSMTKTARWNKLAH